jgi:predicted aldo/keto reductase-like oxidoreductase
MQYRTDPKSGNELSTLGMGCMRLPRGFAARIDADKTEKLVLSAMDRGVNYFDTAYIYGGSESVLGGILHKHGARERVFIATKLPFQQCRRKEDFDRLFNRQLERLKTSYIDYYLIHNISDVSLWEGLRAIGIEEWVAEKKAAGKIRQIGFSFHGAQGGFMSLLDCYDWDFCQIQYNYADENYQAGRAGLKKAHEKGLPVIVMEPLLGGSLATGMPAKAMKHFKAVDKGMSAAAWALRWLWDQPEVTVVLSGMNHMAQLSENAETAESAKPGSLSERERAAFAPALKAYREAYKIMCTGCNYCAPCPRGVNISGCFAAYNMSYAVGFIAGVQQYITSTGASNPEKCYSGRRCVKCGECERKCPQRIEIIRMLEIVTRRMEPFVCFKVAVKVVRFIFG